MRAAMAAKLEAVRPSRVQVQTYGLIGLFWGDGLSDISRSFVHEHVHPAVRHPALHAREEGTLLPLHAHPDALGPRSPYPRGQARVVVLVLHGHRSHTIIGGRTCTSAQAHTHMYNRIVVLTDMGFFAPDLEIVILARTSFGTVPTRIANFWLQGPSIPVFYTLAPFPTCNNDHYHDHTHREDAHGDRPRAPLPAHADHGRHLPWCVHT